jgi:hypothetical protein
LKQQKIAQQQKHKSSAKGAADETSAKLTTPLGLDPVEGEPQDLSQTWARPPDGEETSEENILE